MTTLAGQACASGFEDGIGAAARFDHPTAIAFEPLIEPPGVLISSTTPDESAASRPSSTSATS